MFSYEALDIIRALALETFRDFRVVMFPQSVWLRYRKKLLNKYLVVYRSHPNLTITTRDRSSLIRVRELIPSGMSGGVLMSINIMSVLFLLARSILVPDMAFSIGEVSRFVPPSHDIMWLRRMDAESTDYELPLDLVESSGLSVEIGDWVRLRDQFSRFLPVDFPL